MRVIVSPKASADIEGVLDYIAVDSPRAAVRYGAGLRKKIRSLGRFPRIHQIRDDLPDGMRAAVFGCHLIPYVIEEKRVEGARVVHGAMDLGKVFET